MTAPALPIGPERSSGGAIFGGTTALAAALLYHPLAKETRLG